MTELEAKLAGIALVAVIAVAVAYTLFGRTRTTKPPSELTYAPAADPARDAFAASGDEPPTEDQIARARLGGPRGAPELGQAPLPRQAREQIPGDIDDGHTA
jgi:hypothetical protein